MKRNKEEVLREHLEFCIIGMAKEIASNDSYRGMPQCPEIIRLIQSVDDLGYFENAIDNAESFILEKKTFGTDHVPSPDKHHIHCACPTCKK